MAKFSHLRSQGVNTEGRRNESEQPVKEHGATHNRLENAKEISDRLGSMQAELRGRIARGVSKKGPRGLRCGIRNAKGNLASAKDRENNMSRRALLFAKEKAETEGQYEMDNREIEDCKNIVADNRERVARLNDRHYERFLEGKLRLRDYLFLVAGGD